MASSLAKVTAAHKRLEQCAVPGAGPLISFIDSFYPEKLIWKVTWHVVLTDPTNGICPLELVWRLASSGVQRRSWDLRPSKWGTSWRSPAGQAREQYL